MGGWEVGSSRVYSDGAGSGSRTAVDLQGCVAEDIESGIYGCRRTGWCWMWDWSVAVAVWMDIGWAVGVDRLAG